MPLIGRAAMLLSFDVVPGAIPEHDDWHTHEHFAERLSIPGFVRATRWVAVQGQPRYFVMYEVDELSILTSAPYLERLNNPSPWTSKMMPHYRGMNRGFCSVTGSSGLGLGRLGLLIRFEPDAGAEASLRAWLLRETLPRLTSRPGVGSAHLLEGAARPPMTNEQRIRGADAAVRWALLVTGYDQEAMSALMTADLAGAELQRHGAGNVLSALYGIDYSLTRDELDT